MGYKAVVDMLLDLLARCGVLNCRELVAVTAEPFQANVTIVHPKCSFKGDISTDGDVVVYGNFSGRIDAPQGSVYLHPGSVVSGLTVKCKYLEMKGAAIGIKAITQKFVFDGEHGSIERGMVNDAGSVIEYGQMSLRNAVKFEVELKRMNVVDAELMAL